MRFKNREDAGRKLANKLLKYTHRNDVIILALPRGGVPVAYEVAKKLKVPMDVFLVRKLGVPGQEELAMGAIASGGVEVLNKDIVQSIGISRNTIDKVAEKEHKELERREKYYRGDRPKPEIKGKHVMLIDDGLATGASMRSAVRAVRSWNPAEVIVAVPTSAPDTCELFEYEADKIICLSTPEPFYGVGAWYEDFSQTTDEEVSDLLEKAEKLIKKEKD